MEGILYRMVGIQSQIANERLKCTSLTFDRQTEHLFIYIYIYHKHIHVDMCVQFATLTALILCSVKEQHYLYFIFIFACFNIIFGWIPNSNLSVQ